MSDSIVLIKNKSELKDHGRFDILGPLGFFSQVFFPGLPSSVTDLSVIPSESSVTW